MPKHIDHDQRRADVAAVAADLVVARGRSALTIRNVAEAAGCSTTVVSHYFDDVADLLHETYAIAVDRGRRRIAAVLLDDPTDIVGLIEAVLPLDRERRSDWRVWFAFWSEALASPVFADEQRQRARTNSRRLQECLTLLAQQGRIASHLDIPRTADRLAASIPGIAAEAIFDPRRWTATYQRQILRDILHELGLTSFRDPTCSER